MRSALLVMFVAALAAFAVLVPTPTTAHHPSAVVMADGTDPMPLCRHVDKDGHKCPLPPAMTQASLTPPTETHGRCWIDDQGCRVCQIASQGPVKWCPGVKPINIDEL